MRTDLKTAGKHAPKSGDRPRGKQKTRSHRVRHPGEAKTTSEPATPPAEVKQAKPKGKPAKKNPVAVAAKAIDEAADTRRPSLSVHLTDDERELLREANTAIEAAGAALAIAEKRHKEAKKEFDQANARLYQLSIEIANGISQPALPFDQKTQERDRDEMLYADKQAEATSTPALVDRLRRARYVATPEQLDALDQKDRAGLAAYLNATELAIMNGHALKGIVQPAILTSMHVAGDVDPMGGGQACTRCGLVLVELHDSPNNLSTMWFDVGMRVGADCPGVDLDAEQVDAAETVSGVSPVSGTSRDKPGIPVTQEVIDDLAASQSAAAREAQSA